MAIELPGIHAHVGIVTCDLDASIESVGALLGITFNEPFDGALAPPFASGDGSPTAGLRRVTTSRGGPMRVELLEGRPGSVWHTDEIARLHHVAYWVDDVTASTRRMMSAGWDVEVTVANPDAVPMGFAYVTEPGHARIELSDGSDLDTTLAQLGWGEYATLLRWG